MASTTMAVSSGTTQMGQGIQITTIQDNILIDNNNHENNDDENSSESIDEWNSITNNSTNQNGTPSTGDTLEDISGRNGNNCDENCTICDDKLTSPKVLNCLHVFCEICLNKLYDDTNEQQHINDCNGNNNINNINGYSHISCPICGQETQISTKGVSSLPCDYVLTNIIDMSAIENENVPCTSCKAKENAIARCSDCANFLCPNCNTAHQFMRCFENHKVITFDELKRTSEAVPIHKPIFCQHHTTENMKFYCHTCEEPICNECLVMQHKAPDHHYERLNDAEPRQREDLRFLMTESKSKLSDCEQVSTQLENALSELQSQHDQAKDLINESFQSYKAILEKCRDNAVNELDKLHSERELEVMDTFHNIEKTVEKIEDACKFTSRLIEHADTTELLTLKHTVSKQLLNLISNTPNANIKFSIEFVTDYKRFEYIIKDLFGIIKTECTPEMVKKQLPNNLTIINNHNNNIIDNNNSQQINVSIPCPSTISTTSPISLCGSMQSSFEGDTPGGYLLSSTSPSSGQNNLSSMIPPTPPPQQPQISSKTSSLSQNSQMHCLTSIQEYNLQQLASLAEKVDLHDTSTTSSPTPPFTLADLLAGDLNSTHAINNLQALAKLGNSMGNQDLNNGINGNGNNGNGAGGLMLPRGSSPGLNDNNNMVTGLSTNNLLNGGYQSMSNSTSPILSQGTDDLKNDQMHNMSLGNGIGSTGNFNSSRSPNPKQTPMQIRSKFGQLGPSKGQFNSPHGFCLGTDEDIIVADTNNHRIQIFDKTGQFKSQFGIPGKEEGQLWYPRKVAVMRNCGKFVVCDRGNERSRMQIFTKNGHFIKKIAIRYIDIVAGLAVTSQGHIVAVDSVSPTVFVISDTGHLLRWFDCSDYMREPSDIAISGKEFFVCDFKGHCVVVFNEDGLFLRRIGCENITNFPNGIDISDAGDVLIGDSHGNRFHVAVFSRDGSLISEFECPYVKVSRCCGLKITSEGYIVTLAKNNHHVLVLNTLYIL